MPDQNTVDKIVDAARELASEHGFRKINMDELAKRLHMSKRTIYENIAGKDELVDMICASFVENDRKELERLASSELSPIEKMKAMFYLYNIQTLKKERAEELREHYPRSWEQLRHFSRNRRAFVEQIYREGVEQGEFTRCCAPVAGSPTLLDEKGTVDLLVYLMTSVIDQALESNLADYDFDINTMLSYSSNLIVGMFLVKNA